MTSDPPTKLDKSFLSVLESHVGHDFTVINPESYQETGLGHAIREDWYPAKLAATGHDFVVLVQRFEHGTGKNATSEPVEQYLPISRIKRISILRSGRYLHI